MRVIAGEARSIPLIAPKGQKTRPTSDRIKETLFNLISDKVYNCVFLDLFSGSGQIGIEALSRGAREANFIEYDKEAFSCIKKNVLKTKFSDKSKLYNTTVLNALKNFDRKEKKFDIIYIDPPFLENQENEVLNFIAKSKIVTNKTIIILEISLETNVDFLNESFNVLKEKKYKNSKHIFMEIK